MRFDGIDVGDLACGLGSDRFARGEGDDARHMRLASVGEFLPLVGTGLLYVGQTQFLDNASVPGMFRTHVVLQYVLVEHAADGVRVHGRRIRRLNDVGDHLFGLRCLRFGFAGTGHDRDAVPAHDDGQIGERPFHFPKHLVHRAKDGHRIKLPRNRDGTCSSGHKTSSDIFRCITEFDESISPRGSVPARPPRGRRMPRPRHADYSSSFSPVSTWACTWNTVCPASRPVLKINRKAPWNSLSAIFCATWAICASCCGSAAASSATFA